MAKAKDSRDVPRLEVYLAKSVLVDTDGSREEFAEGQPTIAAKRRLKKIRRALERGYLDDLVQSCKKPDALPDPPDSKHFALLTRLVNSVTSEVGRAIVGLSVLQLAIKSIQSDQSIRLHKGGGTGENFSWADGIPMRVLDKNFCTPILRKHDLIRLNADGVFMTRSLAENYPYSKVYKAALRGARDEWLELVDLVEGGQLNPLVALKHLIAMLFNRSASFQKAADSAMTTVRVAAGRIQSIDDAIKFVQGFVDASTYSARVFEIAMHSLFQVIEDTKTREGFLKPLSQMRSANKKHGNIGDIEITERPESLLILESWDAKYGKSYLREELDELSEKLKDHPETKLAGFVVDGLPNLKREIIDRKVDIEALHSVKIKILSFEEWVKDQAKGVGLSEKKLAQKWILAFAECLCQLRRERAPIDEPCDAWVASLESYAKKWKPS